MLEKQIEKEHDETKRIAKEQQEAAQQILNEEESEEPVEEPQVEVESPLTARTISPHTRSSAPKAENSAESNMPKRVWNLP